MASLVRSSITILHGPAKLFGPMFTRWYGGNWERGLVKLKALMESGEL